MSRNIHSEVMQEQAVKEQARRALAITRLTEMFEEYDMGNIKVVSMQVKYTPEGDRDYMVIMKGVDEDGRAVVAFGTGDKAGDAVQDMTARAAERGLKWRDDKPFKPAT